MSPMSTMPFEREATRIVLWSAGPLQVAVANALASVDRSVECASGSEELFATLERVRPHVVLLESDATHPTPVDRLVREILRVTPETSVLLLPHHDALLAGRFLKAGGHEVVEEVGPVGDRLNEAISRAAERSRLLRRVRELEQEVERRRQNMKIRDWVESSVLNYGRRLGYLEMTGNSEKMQELYERIERLAAHPTVNVTILGERGTGKSLVAKALHDLGPSRKSPFHKFFCTRFQAADPKLTMCELFGWGPRPPVRELDPKGGEGLLEQARGGTVFLDELGDIPALGQNLLLDVVESKTFTRPIGLASEVKVSVRFVFATNRSPQDLIQSGVLREDFWDRISELLITVPPLRQRTEDIPLLVQHFLAKYNDAFGRHVETLSRTAIDRLKSHSWPGNVRELESAVKRALLMCDGDVLDVQHFELRSEAPAGSVIDGLIDQVWRLVADGRIPFADVVEFKTAWGTEITLGVLTKALKTSGGSQKRAGVLLGVYTDADAEKARYAKFRSDVARLRSAEQPSVRAAAR